MISVNRVVTKHVYKIQLLVDAPPPHDYMSRQFRMISSQQETDTSIVLNWREVCCVRRRPCWRRVSCRLHEFNADSRVRTKTITFISFGGPIFSPNRPSINPTYCPPEISRSSSHPIRNLIALNWQAQRDPRGPQGLLLKWRQLSSRIPVRINGWELSSFL